MIRARAYLIDKFMAGHLQRDDEIDESAVAAEGAVAAEVQVERPEVRSSIISISRSQR